MTEVTLTPPLEESGFANWIRSVFDPKGERKNHAQLRHGITVKVDHLQTLLERAQCPEKPRKLILFLDGRPLPELSPYPPTDPVEQSLKFSLDRSEATDKSRDVWTHLLGKPTFDARLVPVSVGLEDEYPVTSTQKIQLEVIPREWFALWASVFLALGAMFWTLAVKSDILRDPGPRPGSGDRKPYSLARTQAAFWFFLILASYLFIGLVTGDYGTTITGTVLALMGISAGTAIGSSVIGTGPVPPAAPVVAIAVPAVAVAVPAEAVAVPAEAAVVAPAAVAVAALTPVPLAPVRATKGRWWLDILSDDTGVNFHRFQMAAWTLVLGIVFVQEVYRGLAMPDFNATLLSLLGISAGTYLGLKATSESK